MCPAHRMSHTPAHHAVACAMVNRASPRRGPQPPRSLVPQRRSVRLRLAYLRMRLQIISESLDIFHRDQFLDPVRPSFKFDCHARETVGWRRRDPPKESFLVDDDDGPARRQRVLAYPWASWVVTMIFLPCGPCERVSPYPRLSAPRRPVLGCRPSGHPTVPAWFRRR